MKTKYKSLTLIELLVSLVLFTILVMGMSAFDIFGHFHAITSDRRAAVQNELSLVLEHMTKHITGYMLKGAIIGGAIGDVNNPPLVQDSNQQGFSIRYDNGNGINYASDGWIGYEQVGSSLYYYSNDSQPVYNGSGQRTNGHTSTTSTKEVLTNHLVPLPHSGINTTWGLYFSPQVYTCDVYLNAIWDSTKAVALDNPQASMKATIVAPAVSAH